MGCIDQIRGFLGRLAQDTRGNTIALMAAALLPMAGLIGGGVDMSRLYLTKTRLQQACDAGALAGRKAMGAGAWTTRLANGTTSTEAKAEDMFNANFAASQYGTSGLTKSFVLNNNDASAGVVKGTASVNIPMTIMKVFGMTTRSISVSCYSKMELPNTDVMFVLDVTLSMQCLPSATTDMCSAAPTGSRRIDGLKHAVKCFYEALERVNTPDLCTPDGVGTNDPTATTASTTAQVRLGFVPYGVNVNVGKILPNSVMANSWVFQSRTANMKNVWAYTLGTESAISGWGNWSSAPSTSQFTSSSNYSGWTDFSSNPSTVTINGTSYATRATGKNSSTCPALNTLGSGTTKVLAYTDGASVNSPALQSTTNNPPTTTTGTSPTSQTLSYNQTDDHTVTGYRYLWYSSGSTCRLQSGTQSYTLTRTGGQSTKSITWTQYQTLNNWTYGPRLIDVTGLKAGGSNWNSTLTVQDIDTTNGASVTLSGQSSPTSLQVKAPGTFTWDGCIEEARTFQNTGGTISSEWGSIPANTYDTDINLVPSGDQPSISGTMGDPKQWWGPMVAKTSSSTATLNSPVWARYPSTDSNAWTNATVTTANDLVQNNYSYVCTSIAAKKLAEYRTNTNFLTFVNSLAPTDAGTYHDIGMLWGARLLSPTGIFASENASAATGGAIQRHLIFMTDGNTHTVHDNYNAYGPSGVSNYQFSTDPTTETTTTDPLVNARLTLLCQQVKNMNVTLWVVFYGASGSTDTITRLTNCATDAQHFFNATDTATLTANFQTIAAKISALRLTS